MILSLVVAVMAFLVINEGLGKQRPGLAVFGLMMLWYAILKAFVPQFWSP